MCVFRVLAYSRQNLHTKSMKGCSMHPALSEKQVSLRSLECHGKRESCYDTAAWHAGQVPTD
jgi:hypothetical protein